MTKEFRAKFHAKGFEVGKDVSWGEWQAAIAEFVGMQNAYAEISNQYLDQLNQTWSQYESIKATDAMMGWSVSTYMAQLQMGVDEDVTYGDWMEKWAKQFGEIIDSIVTTAGFRLRSDIFREDDIPIYGAKFKDQPEWRIQMTLEPVEE